MSATVQASSGTSIQEQAPVVLAQLAGYVGHRTIAVGLRTGLLRALADTPGAANPADLARRLNLEPSYVSVWCRSAYATGICEHVDGGYQLAPHVDTLLLDTSSPAYVGSVFSVLEQPEVFDLFERRLVTGERMWWDDCGPDWLAVVSSTGTPFYTRLVPGGLAAVPGLADRLAAGGRIVDSACGAGAGMVRLARTYPACEVVGIDGDRQSIELARKRLADAGLTDRNMLFCSPLEEMRLPGPPAALVINNISMHECRDIDRVTDNIRAALEPGGWFVVSDFPFPDTEEGLRSLPGRIMCGIQFFEAQIDDQLVPRAYYDDLLRRHGFTDLGSAVLTPMHAITYGRRPA